jgi:hypothetical protein
MAQRYDYLTITLERGRLPDFAKAARGVPGVIGLFQGQLGFASNEAVVLLRDAPHAVAALRAAPGVAGVSAEALTPTVRPAGGKQLKRGGIAGSSSMKAAPRTSSRCRTRPGRISRAATTPRSSACSPRRRRRTARGGFCCSPGMPATACGSSRATRRAIRRGFLCGATR